MSQTEIVTYRNRLYITSLVGVVALASVANLLGILRGQFLAIIPFIFQSAIIVLALSRHAWVVPAIRVWSLLLVLAGAMYWMSVFLEFAAALISPQEKPLLPSKLETVKGLLMTAVLVLGIIFMRFSGRCIVRPQASQADSEQGVRPS